ncbi:MAG: alpha-L-glutamate ligase [Streptomycetaceae bacterium]|nr:alpha-L-glutamate ligase [Streptomycetaceae bacterium]
MIARQAHAAGARVVNDADATAACLDRVTMAERAQAAGLPFPRTYGFARVADVRAPGRLILKQRRSRRGEPVPHCGTADELREAAADWPDEPVVAQEFADGDGWDRKLWVIGDRVFAGLRRSPLHGPDPQGPKHTIPIPAHEIPPVHRELAYAVGECFGLDVYGVDLIAAPEGPRIVDVNAFPGFRSIAEAPAALARFTASRLNAP